MKRLKGRCHYATCRAALRRRPPVEDVFPPDLGATPHPPWAPKSPVSEGALQARFTHAVPDAAAEQRLRESEEKYRALYDNAPLSYQSLDGDGCFIDVNPAWLRTLGYARDEVIGNSFADFVHPDSRPSFEQNFPAFKKRGYVRDVEFKLRHKNGQYVDVAFEGCIGYLPDGSFRQTYCVFQDITARKETEAALRQTEAEREQLLVQLRFQAQQMEQILATVPAGVLLLDGAGRILQVNPMAETILSVLNGAVGDVLTHLGDCPLGKLLTSPPIPGLWHEIPADKRTYEAISRPMSNGTQSEHWVLVIREVTEERRRERQIQQQERLAAVGQLAAGIAHDFNNLMAVIVLYTQMALKTPNLPEPTGERLEIVSRQARRATQLIQQILDFSRRGVVERRPMDLIPFLQEVTELLRRTVSETIQCRLTYGLDDYTVSADPTRLQQVLLNLAFNARDAMRLGGNLHIDLSRVLYGDRVRCVTCGEILTGLWVKVSVRDTGVGIPPEVLPYVFEPFYTTKEVGQGTGLGLPQVYGIVKQHGGHIDVLTQVGMGTSFVLYLPALSVPTQPVPLLDETIVHGGGQTVLVVEDDATLRKALLEGLTGLDYRVLEAAHGRAALEILGRHGSAIALVLSDLVMPEMGGQALFSAMRQQGFAMPVVMLTGHPMEQELTDLELEGLAGWMLKPPDIGRLSRMLAKVLTAREVELGALWLSQGERDA